MKTRIKIVEYGSGRKEYHPQYKGLFFWRTMRTYHHYYCGGEWETDVSSTLKMAQERIDEYLYSMNRNKKVSTTFVKYP